MSNLYTDEHVSIHRHGCEQITAIIGHRRPMQGLAAPIKFLSFSTLKWRQSWQNLVLTMLEEQYRLRRACFNTPVWNYSRTEVRGQISTAQVIILSLYVHKQRQSWQKLALEVLDEQSILGWACFNTPVWVWGNYSRHYGQIQGSAVPVRILSLSVHSNKGNRDRI